MQIDSARRNNFDALRVAAALSVLVSHQHALSGLPEPSAFRRRRMRLALGVSWLLGLAALAARQPLLALWLTAPITVLAIGLASTPYLREAGRFGDLSYGLYIYAFPVQQTLIWAFRDRLPWTAILGSTLCTVFLLAFASWHLVEKRALRLKPGRRPTAPSLARPMALP